MDEEKPKSMEDTLSEAYDELTKPEEEAPEVEETEDSIEEETVDEEAEAEPEPEPEVEVEEEKPQVDAKYKNPPTTWRAKAKSQWAELPDWAKEEVYKREQDSLNGVSSLKEKAEFADRLNNTIQPYQPLLNSMGVTPEGAVRDALNLANSLRTGTPDQKAQLLRSIAKQYQVDLSRAVREPTDIEKALTPYQQQIQALQQQIQQQQTQARVSQEEAAKAEVSNFAAETDQDGNLLHPYFEDVRADMRILVEAGRATTLQDAYDMAVWANPEVRSIMQSQQESKMKEQRRVEKAKKAQSVNLESTPGEDLKSKPKGSIEETLSEAYDRLTAEG